MTWTDKLPEGLVDAFCAEAFQAQGETVIVVRLTGDTYAIHAYAGTFFSRLMDHLMTLLHKRVKADVLILVGRVDRQTGVPLSPQIQIREFGV